MIRALFLITVFSLGLTAQADADTDSRFELVWADEFNTPGAPDPKKWKYDEGFIRNKEAQYYTNNRRKNARIADGNLIIEAHKEKFKNKRFKRKSDHWQEVEYAQYTSACLVTLGKFSQQYGRFECRAKLPKGKGVWPAFWMMGTDRSKVGWPKCGEIDVMEVVGKDPKWQHGTVHFPARNPQDGKRNESNGGKIACDTLSDSFHIYAVEWFPDRMDFYLDDKKFHTVTMEKIGPNEPFHKPFYILLNLAIGGSWGGEIDDKIFPQKFIIDYVRVYKLKNTVTKKKG